MKKQIKYKITEKYLHVQTGKNETYSTPLELVSREDLIELLRCGVRGRPRVTIAHPPNVEIKGDFGH